MNAQPIPLIVDLPRPLAKAAVEQGRRCVYFEATRDNGGADREGEQVAASGLWASRDLFLAQGNLDMAHWSWLPNPITGLPDTEYVVGLPEDVRRTSSGGVTSIWVKGEIFQKGVQPAPEESNAARAERFWYAMAVQQPAMRYFPSVYGRIAPGGVELVRVGGRDVRRITKVEWLSVGFHTRVQHPDLPAVSTSPMGPLAKAEQATVDRVASSGALRLTWGNFAKACSEVGQIVTDHAQLKGVQALTKESLESRVREPLARTTVLRALKDGKLRARHADLAKAFSALSHPDPDGAARDLLRELSA